MKDLVFRHAQLTGSARAQQGPRGLGLLRAPLREGGAERLQARARGAAQDARDGAVARTRPRWPPSS